MISLCIHSAITASETVVTAAMSRLAGEIDTDRVIADLAALNRFGADAGGGMRRTGYSPADMAGRAWLAERFAELGLEVTLDGVGNLFGRDQASRRAVLLGSHSDSV